MILGMIINITLAVIPVTFIFPLAVPNFPFGPKMVLNRQFWVILGQKRLWRTARGKLKTFLHAPEVGECFSLWPHGSARTLCATCLTLIQAFSTRKGSFWGNSPVRGGISPEEDRQGKIWVDFLIPPASGDNFDIHVMGVRPWFFSSHFWLKSNNGVPMGYDGLRGGGWGYVIQSAPLRGGDRIT